MSDALSGRLLAAAAELRGERVRVARLLRAHGSAAPGSLLLLLTVPCLLPLPGAGTVLGLALLAWSLAWWRGQGEVGLPPRVARLAMPLARARQVLRLLARLHGWSGRWSRVRVAWVLRASAQRWVAATVALMAVVLVLPIPFGNLLPALSLVLIALGLAREDGLAVCLGLAGAVLTTAVTGLTLSWALQWGLAGVAQLIGV